MPSDTASTSSEPACPTVLLRQLQLQAEFPSAEDSLFEDPFPLVLALSPFLASSNASQASAAHSCFELLVAHSSAKELALALSEQLTAPSPDEPRSTAKQLAELVNVYGKVLPRIKAKRPASFVRTAAQSICSAIDALAANLSDQASSKATGATVEAITSVNAFAGVLASSDWLAADASQCQRLLGRLVCHATGALHTLLEMYWTDEVFIRHLPRYQRQPRPRPQAVEDGWLGIVRCPAVVNLPHAKLYKLASSASSRRVSADGASAGDEEIEEGDEPSIAEAIGALILIVARLARGEVTQWRAPPASQAIQDTLPLVILATAGDGQQGHISIEAVLYWLWHVVMQTIDDGSPIEDEVLFTLVQLLTPLAALSHDEATRLLAFRLVATLLMRGTQSQELRVILLRDLVGPECPFEPMRVAAVGLVREILAEEFSRGQKQPSLLLSPLFMAELGPLLFRFEPGLDELGAEEFVERHAKRTLDQLSLYFYLLARDAANQTGVRSPQAIATVSGQLLAPLRMRLERWTGARREPPVGALELSQLALVQDALDRVADTLRGL